MPVCAGDGKHAKRIERAADNTQTLVELTCPGPDLCDLVQSGNAICRRQVRMAVQIEGQDDPLSVFEVRSSSLNTYRALKAQLQLIEKRFGGLRHVPLKLALWQASNEASGFEPFSLMRLVLDAASESEAIRTVQAVRKDLQEAGCAAARGQYLPRLVTGARGARMHGSVAIPLRKAVRPARVPPERSDARRGRRTRG